MSKTFFVTGGTGLLGNNIIRQLLDRGDAVRALVRKSSNRQSFAGLDVKCIEGDLHNEEAIRRGCDGAEGVIHSAVSVAIGWSSEPMFSINVVGANNVATAAMSAGCRMVHVSSVNALAVPGFGDVPVNEETPLTGNEIECNYVSTKRQADVNIDSLITSGLDAVIVYPGFMLGPWDWKPSSGRMLQAVGRQFTPFAPSGGCSICDVRDVARAIVAASDGSKSRKYVLAGNNLSYFDLWTKMARIAGSRPPRTTMGPLIRRSVGWVGDLASWFVGKDVELNSAMLAMSAQSHFYSSHRAESELGYRIRDVDETLKDAWDWLESRR
jgi:dihydroflavonol-4-reductase